MKRLLGWREFVAVCLWLLAPQSVMAHDGAPPVPHDLWTAWNRDPLILGGFILVGWLFVRGIGALWRQAGVNRGITRGQAAMFAGGLVALFVALISPIDAVSGSLFAVHMLQHMVLILVTAPLLVLGGAPIWLVWALPRQYRPGLGRWWNRARWLRSTWQILTQPAVVWGLHALALWLWHAPGFYQAALRNEWIHLLEHFSFFATALLFWWVVLPAHGRYRLNQGLGVLYIFTMALQSGILGALITFALRPWYPSYMLTAPAWGLTALEDQQLAGVIMWVPAGTVYIIVALVIFGAWLHKQEQRDAMRHYQIPASLAEWDSKPVKQ